MQALKQSGWILLMILSVAATSCSVISSEVRRESEPEVPFGTLAQNVERYQGKTVILAGYIMETRRQADQSIIEVLQTPTTLQDQPKGKDHSEGRFVVVHKEFLDPEVYKKDRKITVAGTVVDCRDGTGRNCHEPYLLIESRELYLWPRYDRYYRGSYSGYPYYHRSFYRHGFHRHRFHHHGFHRRRGC